MLFRAPAALLCVALTACLATMADAAPMPTIDAPTLLVGIETQAHAIEGGAGYVAFFKDGACVRRQAKGLCIPTEWQRERAEALAHAIEHDGSILRRVSHRAPARRGS